jgi:hypothetical protein
LHFFYNHVTPLGFGFDVIQASILVFIIEYFSRRGLDDDFTPTTNQHPLTTEHVTPSGLGFDVIQASILVFIIEYSCRW